MTYDPPCPDMSLDDQVRHARGFANGVCRNDHHVARLLDQLARSIEGLQAACGTQSCLQTFGRDRENNRMDNPKVNFHLYLNQSDIEKLQRLQVATGEATLAETIRNALRVAIQVQEELKEKREQSH